ncbi:MAG: hypothetical protein V4489_09790, partial [Chlamydiota bacterium]
MTIKINTPKIDMTLIGKAPCVTCLETVETKIGEKVSDFFGHIHEGKTKPNQLQAHLICGSCNPAVISKANSNREFRNCISCSAIPQNNRNWRKKFTWDPEAQEFIITSSQGNRILFFLLTKLHFSHT